MKHALITGGSRRLGLFVTERLLNTGWKVTVMTRHPSDELSRLACERLKIRRLDYDNFQEIDQLCADLKTRSLDFIFHNASLFIADPSDTEDAMPLFDQMFHIHMKLPYILNAQLESALAKSANGLIIHMSDIYAENPIASHGLYCSSKAGLESLSKTFAKKFAPNIRVNTIQPGALKFLPTHDQASRHAILKDSLLGFEGGFEPVFQTIEYLLENTFITGTSLKVDGGRALCR